MKKVVWALALLGFTVCGIAAAKETKQSAADLAMAQEMQKKIEELKKELNGTQWQITLTSFGGAKKGRAQEDTLVFQNNQIGLNGFSGKGFKPTNYTLTAPASDKELAVWETMQTSDLEGTLSFRGEWKGEVMRGIISHQKEKEPGEDYTFTSEKRTPIAPIKGIKEGESKNSKSSGTALVSTESQEG